MIANVLDIAGEMAEDNNESLAHRAQMESRETANCARHLCHCTLVDMTTILVVYHQVQLQLLGLQ